MIRFAHVRMNALAAVCCVILLCVALNAQADPVIIDHNHTDITLIPQSAIEQAKSVLHIAYGHTSHGSQLTTGMSGLVGFANGGGLGLSLPDDIFAWNNGGSGGALDLHDYAMGGDVGYYPDWVNNTRAYLNNPANADVNVIIWSWCGQASGYTEQQMIDNYLDPMAQLELDYPDVTFVYMTGHADGSGETGNLHLRNQQIRNYCIANDKVLYDFYDIELYDPDGSYFGDKAVTDGCDYDSDANGSRDANWATAWQSAHTQNVDWYYCDAAHSLPLNANRKAYAAWWLWATLGGWNQSGANRAPVLGGIGDRNVECQQSLSFTVTASDLDSGDELTFSVNPLPAGAVFDTSSGEFSWTPSMDDEGDYQVTFSVSDDGTPQASDYEVVTISVYAPGTAPDDDTDSGSSGGTSASVGCFLGSL